MLERVAEDVWVLARPLRFLGLEAGTKMTVVRLHDGGLFIHSPVALDAWTREAVDALGPVAAVVAPNRFHHLYVAEWANAYPRARILACPGLEEKRKDVRWSDVLGDQPDAAWGDQLAQVVFRACPMLNEVIFFHRASRTILCSDFIFNLGHHPSLITRVAAVLLGQVQPGPTLLERAMIGNHGAAREQVDRVIAWGAERIVLAHGENIELDGTKVIKSAYFWL